MIRSIHGIFASAIRRASVGWKYTAASVTDSSIFISMDVTVTASGLTLTPTGGTTDSGTITYDPATGYFSGTAYSEDLPNNDWFFMSGSSAGIRCRYIRGGTDTGYTSYLAFDKANGFATATYRATNGSMWVEVEGSLGRLVISLHNVVTRTFGLAYSMDFSGDLI
jgi:hypothetical protein